jgi:hypothetical protein
LLDENHFIFSVLILPTRRPPTAANRFGRAFVAAREQRRKRWQIWGYELWLAIIASQERQIRAPREMPR